MDPLTLIQPAIGPMIGGALTLAGGYFASKRTDKATRVTERRKLSHDSSREITLQLATATAIARRHRDPGSLNLTTDGENELAEVVSKMEHHARYIDDKPLRDAVSEAIGFLQPPPDFEAYLGKSVPGIIHDLNVWLGPMVQAHVTCDKLPNECGKPPLTEPTFLTTYREKYMEADNEWEAFILRAEQADAEERQESRQAAAN